MTSLFENRMCMYIRIAYCVMEAKRRNCMELFSQRNAKHLWAFHRVNSASPHFGTLLMTKEHNHSGSWSIPSHWQFSRLRTLLFKIMCLFWATAAESSVTAWSPNYCSDCQNFGHISCRRCSFHQIICPLKSCSRGSSLPKLNWELPNCRDLALN